MYKYIYIYIYIHTKSRKKTQVNTNEKAQIDTTHVFRSRTQEPRCTRKEKCRRCIGIGKEKTQINTKKGTNRHEELKGTDKTQTRQMTIAPH